MEFYEKYKLSKRRMKKCIQNNDDENNLREMKKEYENLIAHIKKKSYKPMIIKDNNENMGNKWNINKNIEKEERKYEKHDKKNEEETTNNIECDEKVASTLTLEIDEEVDEVKSIQDELEENQLEEEHKVKVNAITVTNPKSLLPYINMRIGESVSNSIFVCTLLDSGASHSLISYQIYLRLKSLFNIEEEKIQPSKTNMKAANKTSISLSHKVNLPITLTDENGINHKFTWPFYVSAEIMDSCYLGEDWVRSPMFKSREKNALIIVENGREFNIPLESRKNSRSVSLLPLNSYIIPERSTQIILTKPAFPHNIGTSVASIALEEDEEDDEKEYEIIDLSQTRNEHDNYIVCIKNNSDMKMVMDTNIPVAKLVHLEEILLPILKPETGKISQLIMPCDDHSPIFHHETYITCQNMCQEIINHCKNNTQQELINDYEPFNSELNALEMEAYKQLNDKIASNHELTSDEKNAKLEEFKKNGYVEKTITEMVDELPVTTEYDLTKDGDEVYTAEEQLKKIKIAHLKPEQQEKVKILLQKFKDILAKSLWDCPKTNLHVADIVLKKDALDGCRICKAISIPLQLKEEVDKSLKSMLKQGIIRICAEPSPYLLNILATRRKNGRIRILLGKKNTTYYLF